MKFKFSLVSILALTLWGCTHAPEVTAPPKRFIITEYGAVGDGRTINTKALQALIDLCSDRGGGVIVVPKGTFLSGALYFKPKVVLFVEKDATLKSTTTLADFPPVYTRWEGVERYWTPAFLNFIGLKNVEVAGEGTIDGSGDEWLKLSPRFRPGATPGSVPPRPAAATSAGPLPKPEDVYPSPLPTTAALHFAADPANLPPVNAAGVLLPRGRPSPPRALVFQNCTGVRISGLILKNQARWGYVFIYCDDVVAKNLIARADHNIPSSDGMDVDSCRHVLITGCDLDCNDDCISIKSGKDEDGRRVNRPCEDIVIEKTRFGYGHGGAAMGSETSGGIRNVEVRDCIAEAGNWAPIRFKSQPTRGGVVENITYRNIELRGTREAFEFSLEWNMRIATPEAVRMVPTVRNVRLINIHGTANAVGSIRGLSDSFIDGVMFENCHIAAQRGLVIEHARNIDTGGLALTVAEGAPVTRQ